jgi:O-antigen/teichoic acid export membrane protein
VSPPRAQPDSPRLNAALNDDQVGQRVVRGSAARLAAYLVANAIAAIAAIVLLRYLGVAGFGRYATVMAVVAIVQIVTDAGLTVTGTHQMALQPTAADRLHLQRQIVTMRALLSLAGLAVAVVVTQLLYGGDLALGALLAGGGAVLLSVQSALVLPLAVEMRNARLGANEVLRNATLLIGAVVAVLAGAALTWFFALQLIAGVVILLATPLLVGRSLFALRPSVDLGAMRRLMRVAIPVAIGSVLSIVYAKVLLIIVSLIGTEQETGLYAASSRVFEIVGAAPALLAGVVLPVLTVAAAENRERMLYVVRRMTEGMALGGLFLAVGIAVAAQPIVEILGGEEFSDAASAVRIQCLALATLFVGNAWGMAALAMGRPLRAAAAAGVGVVAAAIGGVLLVGPLGADGAALAMVIADAALLGAMYLVVAHGELRRELHASFFARAAVVTAAAAGAGFLLPGPRLVAAAVSGLVFLGLCRVLGLIPGEVTDALRRRRVLA